MAKEFYSNYAICDKSHKVEIIVDKDTFKYNLRDIDTNSILSPIWFDECKSLLLPNDTFYAQVRIYDKGYNFVNDKGEIMSPYWSLYPLYFNDDIARIEINGKGFNYINTKGELLSPNMWFDDAYELECQKIARVFINNKGWNYINYKGEILFPNTWYDHCSSFSNGLAIVYSNNQGFNFINTQGEIMSPIWFDMIENFSDNIAPIYIRNKGCNFVNTQGEIMSPTWFDYCSHFYNGYARVMIDNKSNYINAKGQILFPDHWFDGAKDITEKGICDVYEQNKGWYTLSIQQS